MGGVAVDGIERGEGVARLAHVEPRPGENRPNDQPVCGVVIDDKDLPRALHGSEFTPL